MKTSIALQSYDFQFTNERDLIYVFYLLPTHNRRRWQYPNSTSQSLMDSIHKALFRSCLFIRLLFFIGWIGFIDLCHLFNSTSSFSGETWIGCVISLFCGFWMPFNMNLLSRFTGWSKLGKRVVGMVLFKRVVNYGNYSSNNLIGLNWNINIFCAILTVLSELFLQRLN